LTEALKAGNLNFILYLETRQDVYGTAAVNSLMRAIALNPSFSDPYIRAGFFSEDLGLSKQAMVFLNNGLSLNPSAFPGWMLKAKIHQARGERQSMVYSLQQVAKVYTEDNQLKRMIYVAQKADNIQAIPIQIGANYDKLE
jgi:predicted TPR repeat methyltransferase